MPQYENEHECAPKHFLNSKEITMSKRIIHDEWLLMTEGETVSIYYCPFCGMELPTDYPKWKKS